MRLIILFLFCIILTGCFVPPGMRMRPGPPAATSGQQIKPNFIPITVDLVRKMNQFRHNVYNTYYVGPYDVLNIYVWDHPELNAPLGQPPAEGGANANLNPTLTPTGFLVNSHGKVFFPLIGYIDVEGNTVEQIRAKITYALRKYVRKPQVDIRVSGFRSKKIYIMGEVAKPGLQPLTDVPMSITDAINLAGNLVSDAADPGHIFVIRGNYACPDVYWLDASSASALLLAENFYLQPKDVVFVSPANIALWNRAINQVLPTIQTAFFTYGLVKSYR